MNGKKAEKLRKYKNSKQSKNNNTNNNNNNNKTTTTIAPESELLVSNHIKSKKQS